MFESLQAVQGFLQTGGWVLTLLFGVSLIFWTLMLEKYLSYRFYFLPRSKALKQYWKAYKDDASWGMQQQRLYDFSTLSNSLTTNMFTLKVIISLFPLLGLLGTVTGMISVFDSMGTLGTDARAMAAGISMATLPTMAGMFLAVLGLFAYSRLDYLLKHKLTLLSDKLLKESDA